MSPQSIDKQVEHAERSASRPQERKSISKYTAKYKNHDLPGKISSDRLCFECDLHVISSFAQIEHYQSDPPEFVYTFERKDSRASASLRGCYKAIANNTL